MMRDYEKADFKDCCGLVNAVWKFDEHFPPPALSRLFQSIYVQGPLLESHFKKVIEQNGRVVGLLFGKIEGWKLKRNRFAVACVQLGWFIKLLFMRKLGFKKKFGYLNIMAAHEKNRDKLEPRGGSEITLFIVDPECQGQGLGKLLMNEYTAACRQAGISRIVVETDKESNYGFYEHYGFTVKGAFDSPLIKQFSGNFDEAYVYELMI